VFVGMFDVFVLDFYESCFLSYQAAPLGPVEVLDKQYFDRMERAALICAGMATLSPRQGKNVREKALGPLRLTSATYIGFCELGFCAGITSF
jgi:hypothetical protein